MRRLAFLAAILTATPAWASDDRVPPVTDPLVLKECGGCHMAFQPAFLPARSWDRIMKGLADHFGDNVSLPAEPAEAIRTWLMANAADAKPYGLAGKALRGLAPTAAPMRITETPAFERKHRRLSPRVWQDPKVVTRSNCPACHLAADQGWYEDD